MVKLTRLLAEKVDRLKGPLAVFANKVVEFHAPIRADRLNAERPFFTASAGHNLSAESDLHFGTGPGNNDRPVFSFFLFSKHCRLKVLLFSCVSPFGVPDRLRPLDASRQTSATAER